MLTSMVAVSALPPRRPIASRPRPRPTPSRPRPSPTPSRPIARPLPPPPPPPRPTPSFVGGGAFPTAFPGGGGGSGGIDFSGARVRPDGKRCVQKVSSVETVEKDPILQCTHKDVEKCHYTYVTEFEANQEELCNENFEKKCQITFKKEAVSDKVKKCYRPQESACAMREQPFIISMSFGFGIFGRKFVSPVLGGVELMVHRTHLHFFR